MAASKTPKKKVKKVKKAAKKKTLDKAARKADPASVQDAAAAKARNPKAFVFSGRGKAKLQQARSAEKDQRRMHVPVVDTTPEEPPPYVIVVHGPPGVGKTTLIKNLLKHYTNQNIGDIKGPITVVSGKTRRLTFVECPQDLHGMIDAAKYADLVLLMVDGGFGFEMETFEFLNLLQVHGFPKVMGVLTHLDGFKDQKKLKKTKKALKHRFWAEIYQGAKLFYLSGMKNGKYMKREVLNLARFISVMKFRPLSWRMAHPYLLTDRLEDITPVENIRENPKCDREIAVYGYLRGTKLKGQARVHIAGVGDATVEEVDGLVDPCPLPSMLKKRGLNEKERLVYAPMADVGGLLYDKDAVYIDIPDWKMQYSKSDGGVAPRYDDGENMVRELQANQTGIDAKLHQSQINLFSHHQPLLEDHFTTENGADVESDEEENDEEDESGSEGGDGSSDSSDNEEDEDEDEDSEEEKRTGPRGLPEEETVFGNQRSRRRAVFGTEQAISGGSDGAYEDETDAEEEEQTQARLQSSSSAESSGRDSDAESLDSEGLGRASRWKGNMQRHLAGLFSSRSANMQSYIYGTSALDTARGKAAPKVVLQQADEGSDSDNDDLFAPKTSQGGGQADTNADAIDAPDNSRVDLDDALLAKWSEPGRTQQLRNRFVTGDWAAAGERDAARPGAEDEEDGDAFGDFEDLETGEKFGNDGDQATATAMQAIKDAAAEEERQRVAEKASKKAAFNAEYDVGGGKGIKEKPGKARKKNMQGDEDEQEAAEETYYDAMKKDMTDRAARTKAAMDELDAEQRIAMEGYRPGTYLRLKFTGLPCELMQHFDPCQPLLVGGVAPSEEGVGFMQLRFKRHRWFPKILKTRDPLVFSIGWRRFQSVPVYAVEDSNGRHRMLKYTPEHMHCLATIHGALAPPNTGVLAIQTSTANAQSWRISATGVVLNLDASLRVMKKLKLKGTPFKIHKHTAFIGGMFNSQLEVSKFEGASIRTVSGIRGIIKKALRPGVQGSQDGSYRATFEDKPLMSDIVFLRAWIGVDLPRFYNPVTNLLGPAVQPPPRQLKPGHLAPEDPNAIALGATDANAIALPAGKPGSTPQPVGEDPPQTPFEAAATFEGAQVGKVFKTGPQGTGYYPDSGLLDSALPAAPVSVPTGPTETAGDDKSGWTGMRTVAQLRRALGVGAPRDSDSLYKPIERGPRKFNPLKIPKSLQAQLPFKSKVINFPKRKQETLEQKREIKVREPGEKRADALVHALNAIRNAKTEKRLDQQSRRREERKKKQALEEAWKTQYNKEERKKRYRDQGKAEKFAEKRQRRD